MSPPPPPHPDQLVALAVARAYTAFDDHHLGDSMVVRRADVQPEDVLALAGPLRRVEAEALDRWLPHAATTWGEVEDLKALLPRVLELFAAGRLTTTPEVLFGKLAHTAVADWPVEQRAAVDDVVAALWVTTLSSHPARIGYPAWRLLVGLAELGAALTHLLDDWYFLLEADGPAGDAARRHLEDLEHRAEVVTAKTGSLAALFFSDRPREAARLDRWLSTPHASGA